LICLRPPNVFNVFSHELRELPEQAYLLLAASAADCGGYWLDLAVFKRAQTGNCCIFYGTIARSVITFLPRSQNILNKVCVFRVLSKGHVKPFFGMSL